MAKKYMYQPQQDVLYHYIPATAEQIKDGHLPELIIIDEDDPRAQKHLPKKAKRVKPEAVELPESVLDSADASKDE
jgi:hypothetical protein